MYQVEPGHDGLGDTFPDRTLSRFRRDKGGAPNLIKAAQQAVERIETGTYLDPMQPVMDTTCHAIDTLTAGLIQGSLMSVWNGQTEDRIDAHPVQNEVKESREINNRFYKNFKEELERTYPDKVLVIAQGSLLGVVDDFEAASHIAEDAPHRLVFRSVDTNVPGGKLRWPMSRR